MIKNILAACLLFAIVSCTKKSTNPSPTLIITKAQWVTSTQNGFGFVSLILSGSTNADSVMVATYGDGVYSLYKLPMDANKNFNNDTVSIMFTASANTAGSFSTSTTMSAINESGLLTDTLKSGVLHY